MPRPQIPEQLINKVEQLHKMHEGYPAGGFQEALKTVTNMAEQVTKDENLEVEKSQNQPKTAEDMYLELGAIEEGGSIYTLRRSTPYTVEYVERKSRSKRGDRAIVYLQGPQGGEYRLVIDSGEDRFVMEDKSPGEWRTHSTKFSGFRYRSPSHPKNGEKWEYKGR